ncbi:transposase [Streptomyces sp. BA2]|uniref:transposase n=1 Tax=Streptomyces sp. BA2 TaxID=436595 RepID=UPI00136E9A3F
MGRGCRSIGGCGPYPEWLWLRQQFEGATGRFRTGGQWRNAPTELGAWSTVHNRFRQWRDAAEVVGPQLLVLDVGLVPMTDALADPRALGRVGR